MCVCVGGGGEGGAIYYKPHGIVGDIWDTNKLANFRGHIPVKFVRTY